MTQTIIATCYKNEYVNAVEFVDTYSFSKKFVYYKNKY